MRGRRVPRSLPSGQWGRKDAEAARRHELGAAQGGLWCRRGGVEKEAERWLGKRRRHSEMLPREGIEPGYFVEATAEGGGDLGRT